MEAPPLQGDGGGAEHGDFFGTEAGGDEGQERAVAQADGEVSTSQVLAGLEAYAAEKGWDIVLEAADHTSTLRAAGQVNDVARTRALARHPHRRGGRPATPLNEDAFRAEWQAQSRRGGIPSITTIARNLHVSRSRVRARLRDIGLLEGQPQQNRKAGGEDGHR